MYSTQWRYIAELAHQPLVSWRPHGDSNPSYRRERAGDFAVSSGAYSCAVLANNTMTKSILPRPARATKHPLIYMRVGATYTLTFPHWVKRNNFRNNLRQFGRRYGKVFLAKTEGLTLHVLRVQ